MLAGAPGRFADPMVMGEAALPIERLPEPPLEELLRPARGLSTRLVEAEVFERALADDLVVMERTRPDLVVVDNRRSAIVAAERLGLPTISLTTAALLGPHCAVEPRLDQVARIYAPSVGLPPEAILQDPRWAGASPDTVVPLQPGFLSVGMVDLASSGGRARRYAHELCFGDRTLVLDPPALLPARFLPGGAVQPGPIFPRLSAPGLHLPPRGRRLRLYLSFGATGRAEAFRDVLNALLERDLELVVSTGGLVDLPRHPRVAGADLLDADSVFPQVDAVVCHGGTLTVYHALRCGRPVLTVPGHVEQAITAMAVEQAGCGVHLSAMQVALEPDSLVQACLRLGTDPALSEAAGRIGATFDPEGAMLAWRAAVAELLS